MTAVDTLPSHYPMASTETLVLGVDLTPQLEAGDNPTTPTTRLVDLVTGLDYVSGLSGPAVLTGNVISQKVTNLVAGRTYRLLFNYVPVTGQLRTVALTIPCVF